MLIEFKHPSLGPAKTYLTSDVSADATSSTVKSYVGFSSSDYVLFGNFGEESSEIVLLTSVTADTTLGHTTGPIFAHSKDTPVSEIRWNQIEIQYSTSENGTFSTLATVSISADKPITSYDDANAPTSRWYKWRYKNSNAGTYSDLSDAIQATGWPSNSLGGMIEDILEEVGDSEAKVFSRQQIRSYLRDGVRMLVNSILKLHSDCLVSYTTQSLTADTDTYSNPSDFLRYRKVEISFDGSSTYHRARFESETEYLPSTNYQTSDPIVFIRGTSFGIRPTPSSSSGVAKLWYEARPTEMYSNNDTHGLPLGAATPLKLYAISRAWNRKGNRERASDYWKDYVSERNNYLESISEGFQDYAVRGFKQRSDLDMYGNEPVDY